MSLLQRLRGHQVSDATRAKGIRYGLLGALSMVALYLTAAPAAALNVTADVTLYYGLSTIDWIFAALALLSFVGFLWMKHIYLFYGAVIFAIGIVVLMFLGY